MKTRTSPLAGFLVLAIVGLLLLAGCGGGGELGSTGGGGCTSPRGAEAACTTANKQIAALGTPQQAEVLQYLEQTEAVIEKLHNEVAALGGSGSAETAYTAGAGESGAGPQPK